MEAGVPLPVVSERRMGSTGPWLSAAMICWTLAQGSPPTSSRQSQSPTWTQAREGHESELLRNLAEEFPGAGLHHLPRPPLQPGPGGQQCPGSPDLDARAPAIGGFVTNMDQQERLDQYQQDGVRVDPGVTEGAKLKG